jgi:hypothetical protein
MTNSPCNPFGFPIASQHVSGGAFAAIVKAAGTVDQLNLAVETISRAEQTPVKVSPPRAPSNEISPACKKYYDELADHGSADEVLKVASISRRFRTSYPAAVAWAKGKKKPKPQDSAIA